MELQRRGLLLGLLAAPFVIRTPGLLMPVSARAMPAPPRLEAYVLEHSNGVLSPRSLTLEALAILENNLVAASKINFAFQNGFTRIGAALTVRQPGRFGRATSVTPA
jgi:hypothetical protein